MNHSPTLTLSPYIGPQVTICLQLGKLSWKKKKKNIFHDVIHRFSDCSQDKIAYNVNQLRNYFYKEISGFRTLSGLHLGVLSMRNIF